MTICASGLAACEAARSMTTATLRTAGRTDVPTDGNTEPDLEALPSWFVVAHGRRAGRRHRLRDDRSRARRRRRVRPGPDPRPGCRRHGRLAHRGGALAIPGGARPSAAQLAAAGAVAIAAGGDRVRRSGTTRSTSCSIAIPVATWSRGAGWPRTTTSSSTPGSARSRRRRACGTTPPRCSTAAAGSINFQFSHLLPTLLAQARWIGGDGLMFFAPPILGGLGLL